MFITYPALRSSARRRAKNSSGSSSGRLIRALFSAERRFNSAKDLGIVRQTDASGEPSHLCGGQCASTHVMGIYLPKSALLQILPQLVCFKSLCTIDGRLSEISEHSKCRALNCSLGLQRSFRVICGNTHCASQWPRTSILMALWYLHTGRSDGRIWLH